ncbi:MAG: ABC transporter ATP-binding protein [Eubacteriales bacterium]|jgi:putative ABC transport system ATP-binding protein
MIIKCKNVTKIYPQGDKSIYAVNNCSVTIMKGLFTAVVGASGSGKSTFLNLLAAYDRPDGGEILYDGLELSMMRENEIAELRSRRIGFIFQSFRLLPILTAKENIIMPALISGRKFSNHYFDEITGALGIADYLENLPGELSGGQQQRVAAARALINKPSVLLADEPTGNLDSENANGLMSLLDELRRAYKMSLVMVTHNEDLADMADIVYKMSDGVISLKR